MATRRKAGGMRSASWAAAIAMALTMGATTGVPAGAAVAVGFHERGEWTFNDDHEDSNGSPLECNHDNASSLATRAGYDWTRPVSGAWTMSGGAPMADAEGRLLSLNTYMCGWYEDESPVPDSSNTCNDQLRFLRGSGGVGWMHDDYYDTGMRLYDIGWELSNTLLVVTGHYQVYSGMYRDGQVLRGTPEPRWGEFTMTIYLYNQLITCNAQYAYTPLFNLAPVVLIELPEAP